MRRQPHSLHATWRCWKSLKKQPPSSIRPRNRLWASKANPMSYLRNIFSCAGLVLTVFTIAPCLSYAQAAQTGAKNIVLVHGAFADATSWSKVIPILEADGYHVVAVQNPLISLTEDVAAPRRAVALQDG